MQNEDFVKDRLEDPYNDYKEDESATFEDLVVATRLTKDLKMAAVTLQKNEVRYLVDLYYNMQRQRIRASAQVKASTTSETPEPNTLIAYMFEMYTKLELDMKSALEKYSESLLLGRWLTSIMGIGPVIAAGLLCHIDYNVAQTSGDVWRYAGYDPTCKWYGTEKARQIVKNTVGSAPKLEEEEIKLICDETNRKFELFSKACQFDVEKGYATHSNVVAALAKRPWNASLKRLGYLAGESFVKTKNKENSYYGPLYNKRKLYETEKNEDKQYREQAEYALATKNFGSDTEARKWYEMGMLPPAHIHSRVRRWVVRMFLSHLFQVGHEIYFKEEMVKPWIMESEPEKHTHFIAPPNWPYENFDRNFERNFS